MADVDALYVPGGRRERAVVAQTHLDERTQLRSSDVKRGDGAALKGRVAETALQRNVPRYTKLAHQAERNVRVGAGRLDVRCDDADLVDLVAGRDHLVRR